eukprot:TRINITY_DN2971_c0_g2_i1.p1 TRINITY_DN2971_c0_g2~~TRINITY_DN2971_c0_g2_i1.p1  ORF type:complete len:632 (+),score=171.45 TRINITY_DN2971_c0_g2_i1:239-1897(+)
MAAAVGVLVALLLWVWITREMSAAYLRVATVALSLIVAYADLMGAAMWTPRAWPIYVVVLDILLVIDARRLLTTWLVAFVLVWNFVVEVEYSYRAMGLFDLADTRTYDARRAMCDCEKPPCAEHMGPQDYAARLCPVYIVFLADFFLTRGFADQVRAGKRRMTAAVEAAENIARSLAGFDLDTAAACLMQAQGELPEDLYLSLEQLLHNLGTYKPYLPQSMVMGPGDGDAAGSDEDNDDAMQCEASVLSSLASSRESDAESLSTSRKGSARRFSKVIVAVAAQPLKRRDIAVVGLTLHAPDVMAIEPAPDAYEPFTQMHADFLAAVLDAASAHRGIVDTFTGAFVEATFNASRPTMAPAGNALRMLQSLRGAKHAACSGAAVLAPAVVGVLGTDALRRPTLLGEAPALARGLVRYARAAGVDFVCDRRQYMETRLQQAMRVVMDHVWLGGTGEGEARQVVVYEMLQAGGEDGKSGPQEWMYELASSDAEAWSAYNAAGLRKLLGEAPRRGDEEALLATGRAGPMRRWEFGARVTMETASEALDVASDESDGL